MRRRGGRRPGAAARRPGSGHRRATVDQQRPPDDASPARPRRPRRVLDVRLNQLPEREPAVGGVARTGRVVGAHRRRCPQPGVLLGEAAREGRRRDEAARRALPGRAGQRLRDLDPVRRASVAHPASRGPEGGRPVPAHRRGRLCGDRGRDPAAPRRGRFVIGARSPSTWFSILGLAAIVAPATVVAVLGYVSLRQWEAAADLLFREQARDVAAMAAEKVEMMLRHAEDAFLDRLQAELVRGSADARALDELVAQFSLIRRLYVFDRRDRLVYPGAWRDDDAAVFRPLLLGIPAGCSERGGQPALLSTGPVLLATLPPPPGAPVLVGRPRDLDTPRREIFETTLGGAQAPHLVAVGDPPGPPGFNRSSLERAQRVPSGSFRAG